MKEHPILFNGEMVRAILDGRKTQTRRMAKCNAASWECDGCEPPWPMCQNEYGDHIRIACPYGQPGDLLWVRETWAISSPYNRLRYQDNEVTRGPVWYAADDSLRVDFKDRADIVYGRGKWRPSIHMPRWASRITLEVVAVRVERVRDITESDAKAESVTWPDWEDFEPVRIGGFESGPARIAFRELWSSINDSRGYGWDANPFVWVVEFKVIERAGL